MIKRFLILALAATFLVSVFGLDFKNTSAASLDSGNVISNGIFYASNTMSAGAIDSWLNGFSGSCISPNKGFRTPALTGYSPSSGFTYGGLTTAGVVIAKAAAVYGINP